MQQPLTTVRSSAKAPRFFVRHRRKVLVAIAVLAVVAADFAGTALLRITGVYTPASRVEAEWRREDPHYHHGLQPNHSAVEGGRWGHASYAVHTNSLGFKDRAVRDVPPQGSHRRVLLIGDSFTEGVGCPFEATFDGILAHDLEPAIEVLNAGCVTYCPVIYRRKVQHLLEGEGLRFDHLVVCLDMSDIVDEITYYRLDDAGNVERREDSLSDRTKHFVSENTILLRAIREGWHAWREANRDGNRHVLGHRRSSWTHDPRAWAKYGEPGLRSASQHLDALWQLLKARSITMTLVVYPWPDQIVGAERDCVQVTHWRAWTAERGIAFIDLFPVFLDAGPAPDVVARYFIPGDMHWNEAGHALVARALLAQLKP